MLRISFSMHILTAQCRSVLASYAARAAVLGRLRQSEAASGLG